MSSAVTPRPACGDGGRQPAPGRCGHLCPRPTAGGRLHPRRRSRLGKDHRGGLVVAQLLAEGAKRILLITPKPLLGQWRQELSQLFSIDAIEARAEVGAFDGEGVFLIGREAAGSVKDATP